MTLEQQIGAFQAVCRHAGAGAGASAGRLPRERRHRAASVPRLVLRRRSRTTRTSATTTSTRGASRCRSCSPAGTRRSAWFNPELLKIPLETVRGWMDADTRTWRSTGSPSRTSTASRSTCSTSRASGCCRSPSRLDAAPNDGYAALSTADCKHPTSRCPTGERVTLTYGQYRAILATNRAAGRPRGGVHARSTTRSATTLNTYASLYNGVLQRDWFHARARGYASTLEAALHGNNIPTAVVENLIETTQAGVEPLRRYHRLRKRVLGLDDVSRRTTSSIPLVDIDRKYPYDDVLRLDRRVGGAARRRLPAADARGVRGPLDRRLRERREAQRRVLGAGVRRAPVHAAELQRHAGRRVHAGARDGPLDAHAAVARARSRSSIPATRSSSPRCRPR